MGGGRNLKRSKMMSLRCSQFKITKVQNRHRARTNANYVSHKLLAAHLSKNVRAPHTHTSPSHTTNPRSPPSCQFSMSSGYQGHGGNFIHISSSTMPRWKLHFPDNFFHVISNVADPNLVSRPLSFPI